MDSSYPVEKSASKRQKLQYVFDSVRETGQVPDLSEDVAAILHKKTFDKVIRAAAELNRKEKATEIYSSFILRAWQEKVVADLEDQSNRTVLWVFDFDGKTGKTELANYLCAQKGLQKLFPRNFILL